MYVGRGSAVCSEMSMVSWPDVSRSYNVILFECTSCCTSIILLHSTSVLTQGGMCWQIFLLWCNATCPPTQAGVPVQNTVPNIDKLVTASLSLICSSSEEQAEILGFMMVGFVQRHVSGDDCFGMTHSGKCLNKKCKPYWQVVSLVKGIFIILLSACFLPHSQKC